jgi:hypothetical protein
MERILSIWRRFWAAGRTVAPGGVPDTGSNSGAPHDVLGGRPFPDRKVCMVCGAWPTCPTFAKTLAPRGFSYPDNAEREAI